MLAVTVTDECSAQGLHTNSGDGGNVAVGNVSWSRLVLPVDPTSLQPPCDSDKFRLVARLGIDATRHFAKEVSWEVL